MAKFVLPFIEGGSDSGSFSPTAMLVTALAFAVIVSVQTSSAITMVLIAVVLFGGTLARTQWRSVFSLATKLEAFVLLWILLEPFLYGTTVVAVFTMPWGPVHVYSEGIAFGILLGLRMFCILLMFIATLSHMSLAGFIGALRTLRVPSSFVGSLLIMLRYIPLFTEERTRMQDAQALRGYERGARKNRVESLGFLLGSMIDRAFNRSVAVYESMILRGFGRGMHIRGAGLRRMDAALLILLLILVLSLVFILPDFMGVLVI